MEKTKILAIDDEPALLDLLVNSLSFAGFEVNRAISGSDGLKQASEGDYELIVCDVMLPDFNGFTLLTRLRDMKIYTPVLFLTARDSVEHKIQGLTVGGDDYMTKPFSIEELIARVRAILRRTNSQKEENDKSVNKSGESYFLEVKDLKLFPDSHEVYRGDHEIELSPTEYRLLEYLMENQGRVLSKQQILEYVWNYDYTSDYAIVETYVSYLRKKVDYDNSLPKLIQTKRSVGYMIK